MYLRTVASFALWSLLESNRALSLLADPDLDLDLDLEGFLKFFPAPALAPSDAAPPFRSIH